MRLKLSRISSCDKMTPFAVAIVNYNTREPLRSCLASVQSEAPSEVVVVDNASSDDSIEMVEADFPWVMLLANKINCGYGAAANQAIACCTAKYVLLLNSDTLLRHGAIQNLASYLDSHPRAAIVGPRLINPNGTLQASCYPFPTLLNTLLVNTSLGRLMGYVPVLRDYYLPTWPHNSARLVDWVKGAALALRREAFEAVGGFDESFFMYFEETDLCHRLKNAGWEVHFAPVATVVHAGEASTSQRRTNMTVQLVASNLLYCQRHYSRLRFVSLVLIMKGTMLVRLLCDSVRLLLSRNTSECARIAADAAAWQRVLLGRWKAQRRHE
jgi:GT2 family glycosyltransferase